MNLNQSWSTSAQLLSCSVILVASSTALAGPPHDAARNGDAAQLESHLKKNRMVVKRTDEQGMLPLHAAVATGQKGCVELLLNYGADVNAAMENGGWTPLLLATQLGNQELMELLLNKGADLQAQLPGLGTALHLAVGNGQREIVDWLLQRRADVNARATNGATPLHVAAIRGDEDFVSLLLSKGAKINAKTTQGVTPLQDAVFSGQVAIIQLLVRNGAEINSQDLDGRTPLHVASIQGRNEIAEFFLTSGANVNAKDRFGLTPLHYVAFVGNRVAVELLLSKGAGVNVKSEEGETPLSYAAQKGHTDIAELLISKGAEISTNNKNGDTPLHAAAEAGRSDLIDLLLKRSPDANARNKQGATPLDFAVENENDEVAELLRKRGCTQGTFVATIALQSGDVVRGRVLSSTERDVQIELAQNNRTIVTTRTISRSEIKSIQSETPEQRRQRKWYESLLRYRLDSNAKYAISYYEVVIGLHERYLTTYPDGEHVVEVRQLLTTWKSDLSQASSGKLKLSNRWWTLQEAKNLVQYKGQWCLWQEAQALRERDKLMAARAEQQRQENIRSIQQAASLPKFVSPYGGARIAPDLSRARDWQEYARMQDANKSGWVDAYGGWSKSKEQGQTSYGVWYPTPFERFCMEHGIEITAGAGEFGPLINPSGINY